MCCLMNGEGMKVDGFGVVVRELKELMDRKKGLLGGGCVNKKGKKWNS